eukprot:TRINITY_DN4579_c2_g1_i1.p1 TRINITY_DN4579_c2_g1~~TRINITY_DN4579_c2_g1_i1.p1  ORF type:complete len:237 (-),score=57.10 TRINITY_DN4579_c2_g1_i1:689-1399(-)
MKHTLLLLLILNCFLIGIYSQGLEFQPVRGYNFGEPLKISCKNPDGSWGRGPVCANTGMELQFNFGVDNFHLCDWYIATEEDYEKLSSLSQQQSSWECRINVAPEVDFHIPFAIPIWGVVEEDHMHVNNHLNFVFHALDGKIVGATSYPIRDMFQFCTVESIIHFHGAIKWFRRGTFESYSGHVHTFDESNPLPLLGVGFLSSVISMLFCVIVATCSYKFYFKQKLYSSYIKMKSN